MIIWGLIVVVIAFLAYNRFTSDVNSPPLVVDDIRPFSLTNHKGEPVSHNDFAGKYMLIFFGYSFCPDVCPTELGKVSVALDMLEKEGRSITNLQPIFITIDPARDSVQQLNDYMSLFHPRFIGLTGTAEEIDAVNDNTQEPDTD